MVTASAPGSRLDPHCADAAGAGAGHGWCDCKRAGEQARPPLRRRGRGSSRDRGTDGVIASAPGSRPDPIAQTCRGGSTGRARRATAHVPRSRADPNQAGTSRQGQEQVRPGQQEG